jgi:branched-chain amino acid transport system ATP-binding protein
MPDNAIELKVNHLQAWYGDAKSLHGVNLQVNLGEVVAIMGRNGAGKSTTLKCIMGLLSKKTGEILHNGQNICNWVPEKIAKLGLAYCPEERGIYSSLNVYENLILPPIVKDGGFSLEEIYDLFPNLQQREKNQGSKLSGGEQQMLAIARILRTGSRLLLLDEPTEGLAPIIVEKIGDVIAMLKNKGFTILIVEQNYQFVSRFVDRIYIMENGEMIDQFDDAQNLDHHVKIRSYLGI